MQLRTAGFKSSSITLAYMYQDTHSIAWLMSLGTTLWIIVAVNMLRRRLKTACALAEQE